MALFLKIDSPRAAARWSARRPQRLYGLGTRMLLRENGTFFEFSLCLSRACLGKIMHFIYKWRKKRRFLTLHSQPPRRLRAPRPRHRSRRLATSASIRIVLREKTASSQFPVNDDLPRQAWDKHEDRLLSISYDKNDDLPRQAWDKHNEWYKIGERRRGRAPHFVC
jgi:hypothetical protein